MKTVALKLPNEEKLTRALLAIGFTQVDADEHIEGLKEIIDLHLVKRVHEEHLSGDAVNVAVHEESKRLLQDSIDVVTANLDYSQKAQFHSILEG